MAISVTEILGTDSLSGSRLVINDNFNVLTSEINAMEVYFAPSAGTITNLNNVSTEALRVGLSTILLDINASTFDILTNVSLVLLGALGLFTIYKFINNKYHMKLISRFKYFIENIKINMSSIKVGYFILPALLIQNYFIFVF